MKTYSLNLYFRIASELLTTETDENAIAAEAWQM